jgi:alpha-glucosidase
LGRDGCRVPLPWEAGVEAANGFNLTGKSWLPQPTDFKGYSRDLQEDDPGSTLSMYQQAIRLRKTLDLGNGSFRWLDGYSGNDVLGFQNKDVLVIHNFGSTPLNLPTGKIICASQPKYRDSDLLLEPNDTVWILAGSH